MVVSVVLSMLLPLLSLGFLLERLQPVAPELLEELLELGEALWPRAVEATCPVSPLVHESGLLQDGQMLGDGRTGHVEVRCDLARRKLGIPDEAEDPPPVGLRDRLQCRLHGEYLSKHLRKYQLK